MSVASIYDLASGAAMEIPRSLDYERMSDPRWCPDCGGMRTFIPVEEFGGGWRGFCLGCEQEKYVLFTRTVAA